MSKSKILIWDIETAPMENYTWDLYPLSISHDNIIKDWSIICGCWKFVGDKTIKSVAVDIKSPRDDKEVVKKLRDVVASADVIVHHYGDRFDLKKLNARIIYYGLDPLPNIPTVDTKKQASKVAAFTSNRLDYLSKLFFGVGKTHIEFQRWIDIINGNKAALKEMVDYNKVDVQRLEDVYLYLLPYMKGHPHMGAMNGEHRHYSCTNCGSTKIKLNGVRYTAAGLKKQEIQCKECHHYSKVPYAVTKK